MSTNKNPLNSGLDRRNFLKRSALGAGLLVVPSFVAGQSNSQLSPSERLNIAYVGVEGRGRGHIMEGIDHNVIGLCDVDRGRVEASMGEEKSKSYADVMNTYVKKGAKWFTDYRVMLEEIGDKIDALFIATPDHMHFPIALSAINMGINVYVEKPLTHTVEEARILAEAAAKKGVVTQMGNQGHSNAGTRAVKEWLDAGIIGDVREVHSWTDRPAVFWEQGLEAPDHSNGSPPIPEKFDWDLWQGVAERRAYDPAYAPFTWRAYPAYGCGSLGDMACHIMDSAFWGLGLGSPTSIEAITSKMTGYTYPSSSVVTFKFPSRGKSPALTYKWHDGGLYPTMPKFLKKYKALQTGFSTNGTLIVGAGAAILTDCYSESVKIIPDAKSKALRPSLPPKTLRRIRTSHQQEFLNAIKEKRQASSDFSYAGPFAESILLGCVAQRLGRKLTFDGKEGKFLGDAEANKLLRKDYPKGWILS